MQKRFSIQTACASLPRSQTLASSEILLINSVISLRVEMFATYETSYRVEEKIYDYFDRNGCSALTAGIEKLMKVGEQTKLERLEVYKRHCDKFFEHIVPVDVLVEQLDNAKSPVDDYNDIPDEWLTDFLGNGMAPPK